MREMSRKRVYSNIAKHVKNQNLNQKSSNETFYQKVGLSKKVVESWGNLSQEQHEKYGDYYIQGDIFSIIKDHDKLQGFTKSFCKSNLNGFDPRKDPIKTLEFVWPNLFSIFGNRYKKFFNVSDEELKKCFENPKILFALEIIYRMISYNYNLPKDSRKIFLIATTFEKLFDAKIFISFIPDEFHAHGKRFRNINFSLDPELLINQDESELLLLDSPKYFVGIANHYEGIDLMEIKNILAGLTSWESFMKENECEIQTNIYFIYFKKTNKFCFYIAPDLVEFDIPVFMNLIDKARDTINCIIGKDFVKKRF